MINTERAMLTDLENRRVAWHMASLLGVGTAEEWAAWAAYQNAIDRYHHAVLRGLGQRIAEVLNA